MRLKPPVALVALPQTSPWAATEELWSPEGVAARDLLETRFELADVDG
jgi:hypothetical protein